MSRLGGPDAWAALNSSARACKRLSSAGVGQQLVDAPARYGLLKMVAFCDAPPQRGSFSAAPFVQLP